MTVFRILASRTELYLIEAYVKASNSLDAEIVFYGAVEDDNSAIMWTQVFDGSDTEIDSVERVPMSHDPVPSGIDRSHCLHCGRIVRWTGTSAQESPTGASMPGPWIHVERPIVEEGLGL